MLSTADLAGMRATLNESLPDSCDVLRRVLTPDGSGGYTEAWVTVLNDRDCRINELDSRSQDEVRERIIREYGRIPAIATFVDATDVHLRDQLGFAGALYEVVSEMPTREWGISHRLIIVEVD